MRSTKEKTAKQAAPRAARKKANTPPIIPATATRPELPSNLYLTAPKMDSLLAQRQHQLLNLVDWIKKHADQVPENEEINFQWNSLDKRIREELGELQTSFFKGDLIKNLNLAIYLLALDQLKYGDLEGEGQDMLITLHLVCNFFEAMFKLNVV
jgi:hypothetical protein